MKKLLIKNKNSDACSAIELRDIMELSDEMLIELSYIEISQYRKKVMKTLAEDAKIPTQIARDSEIRVNHISKVLSELSSHDLVECINPEVRKGRVYRLTDKGEKVGKHINTD